MDGTIRLALGGVVGPKATVGTLPRTLPHPTSVLSTSGLFSI